MSQKIIFLLLLFFNLSVGAEKASINSPGQKIAVVDVQTILDQSTAVSGIRKMAEKINHDLQSEFSQKENELKQIETKLLDERGTMPPEKFEQEVVNFNKKVTEAQKIIQDKKIKLEQAHTKAISQVNEVALKIIADLAFEGKYDIILPSTQVLYANEKLNITDEVLSRLNAKIPSVALKF